MSYPREIREPRFWTAYRKLYVRELLKRGASVRLIAYRLGKKPIDIRHGIHRYGLREPA